MKLFCVTFHYKINGIVYFVSVVIILHYKKCTSLTLQFFKVIEYFKYKLEIISRYNNLKPILYRIDIASHSSLKPMLYRIYIDNPLAS